MDQAAVIEKVKKLLNFAKNGNVPEVASAAFLAQKLIAKHGIDEILLTQDSPVHTEEKIETREVYKFDGPRATTWIMNLGTVIASVNYCKLWFSSGDRRLINAYLQVAGREVDIANITHLLSYLVDEVEILAAKAAKEFRREHGYAGGKHWTNSFKLGCVSTLTERLTAAAEAAKEEARSKASDALVQIDDQDEETPTPKYEIAVINHALVELENIQKRAEEWATKEFKLHAGRPRARELRYDAWDQGKEAAEDIDLNPSLRIKG